MKNKDLSNEVREWLFEKDLYDVSFRENVFNIHTCDGEFLFSINRETTLESIKTMVDICDRRFKEGVEVGKKLMQKQIRDVLGIGE